MNDPRKRPTVEFEERTVQIALSKTEIINLRIRLGGTDVQIPPAPPKPRPKARHFLDVDGNYFLELNMDVVPFESNG